MLFSTFVNMIPVLTEAYDRRATEGPFSSFTSFRILGLILSGPLALDRSRFLRSFTTPGFVMLISWQRGSLLSYAVIPHLLTNSSSGKYSLLLNAAWNHLFSIYALSVSSVISLPLSFSGAIPEFSVLFHLM